MTIISHTVSELGLINIIYEFIEIVLIAEFEKIMTASQKQIKAETIEEEDEEQVQQEQQQQEKT